MTKEIVRSEQEDQRLDQLEVAMLENFPVIEPVLKHTFAPGIYIREMRIPEGALITSKIHKTEHPFVVSEGSISVWENDGEEKLVEAPFTGVSKPGTRRVGYAHTDVTWLTIHRTEIKPENETEQAIGEAIAKIEAEIIEPRENKLAHCLVNSAISGI